MDTKNLPRIKFYSEKIRKKSPLFNHFFRNLDDLNKCNDCSNIKCMPKILDASRLKFENHYKDSKIFSKSDDKLLNHLDIKRILNKNSLSKQLRKNKKLNIKKRAYLRSRFKKSTSCRV